MAGAARSPAPRALPSPTPLHASLAGCEYCENFCYDHWLEWRWRHARVVCPEVPRARQYVLGGGGGMTEVPGSAQTDAQARRRSGTELNSDADAVARWAFRDGEWRARCRRVLSATGFGLCVAAVAAVLIEACARFGARACGGGSADRVWRRARGGGEGGGGFGSVGPVSAALKAA